MAKVPACCPDLSRWLPSHLFKALAEPSRVAILCFLAQQGAAFTVSQVAQHLPQDVSVVSRHLGLLREAGIVEANKVGKQVWYRLAAQKLADFLRGLADALDECCPAAQWSQGPGRLG